jgi:hypothetical protein
MYAGVFDPVAPWHWPGPTVFEEAVAFLHPSIPQQTHEKNRGIIIATHLIVH